MVVCISRLLAVVVGLKKYGAPPLLYVSDEIVNSVLLVYDKQKRIVRTYYTLDIYPFKNRPTFLALEVSH